MFNFCKLFFYLLAGLAIGFPSHAECLKTMAWSDDYPYSFRALPIDSQPSGIEIKTAQAALLQLNCTIAFAEMPFARAIKELENGEVDIISGAFATDNRRIFAHYSSVEFQSPNVLFLRTEDIAKFPLTGLSDISKYQLRLGGQLGVTYSSEYSRLKSDPDFSNLLNLTSNRKALWKMLELNRIDAVIADLGTGNAEIKHMGLQNRISASQLVVSTQPAFYIFSKKTTDIQFVHSFDKALELLEENGTLKEIKTDYY